MCRRGPSHHCAWRQHLTLLSAWTRYNCRSRCGQWHLPGPGLRAEEARKAEIEKLHGILTANGGEVTNVNEWGLREFAYPINDMLKGYYVVIKVAGEAEGLKEFDRLARLDNAVIRFLITVDKE